MPDAGYLPPVVARIVGDITDLARKLEEAKDLLRDFAKEHAAVRLTADDAPLIADLRGAKIQLTDYSRKTYTVKIGADTTEALADVAKLRAEIDAMKANMRVGANGHPVVRTLAAGSLGRLFGTGRTSLLGAALWGDTGGGFLSRLLSPLTAVSTMFSAGFGSIGSFAGFGPEHLAMTLAGIGGLGVEASAGAGLLGLGTLGKDLVGGGADALTNRTAMNAVQGYSTLAQTVAEFGKNSAQAKDQASLLAYSLRGDSSAAKSAAKGVADASSALVTKWHAASSGAQQQADKLMRSVLNLASAFAGRVAKAAQTNLSIINAGLKPLFSWLKGPEGVGVFNTLEGVFRRDLPTAVHAFDQGIEVLLKTMAFIAPKTGGAIKSLDRLFTRMNTPAGFSKWKSEINKLIGDFRIMESFFKTLGHDLHSMFKDDAGEPQAIIEGLTGALKKLGKWEDSLAGKKSISAVFTSHKGEIMAMGASIGPLIKAFGQLYMTISPHLVNAVTKGITFLARLFSILDKAPGGKWIVGLSLLALHMKSVRSAAGKALLGIGGLAVKGAAKLAGLDTKGEALVARLAAKGAASFAKLAAKGVASFATLTAKGAVWAAKQALVMGKVMVRLAVLVAKQIAATAIIVAQFIARAAAAMAAYVAENLATLGIIAGITLLVAAIVYLATHWRQVWNFIKRITTDVAHAVTHFFENLWHDIVRIATDIWHSVSHFFVNLWHDVSHAVSSMVTSVLHFFENLWHKASSSVSNGVRNIVNWFKGLPGKILGALGHLGNLLWNIGGSIISGLWGGLKSMWNKVTGWFSGIGSWIKNHKGPPAKDAVLLTENGRLIMRGFSEGLKGGFDQHVAPLIKGMNGQISSGLSFNGTVGVQAAANPQLVRIERLLSQIADAGKQTVDNTSATAHNVQGLSSPAGVQAQIRRSHGQLVTALRAGTTR